MGPSGGRKKLLAEINMVPFIDIVLVLLIIFMIMSPFIAQSQIPVNLPRAASKSPGDDNPVKIQVTKNGDYYIAGNRVLRNDIVERLNQALSGRDRKTVLIEADRDVSFKNVVLALDAAHEVRAAKVGVAAQSAPPDTPPSPQ